MRCPSCDAKVPAGETICMECGTELVIAAPVNAPAAAPRPVAAAPAPATSARTTCPDCGESVIPDSNGWCPVCGHDFAPRIPSEQDARNREDHRSGRPLCRPPEHDDNAEWDRNGLPKSTSSPEFDEREFFREPPSLDQVRAERARAMQQGGGPRPAGPILQSAAPLPGAAVPLPGEAVVQASAAAAQAQLPGDRRKTRFQGGDSGGFAAATTAASELSVEGGQKVFFDGAMTDRIRLDIDQLLIGRRDPAQGHYPEIDLAHLMSLDPHISRRHARIYRAQGRWRVEDLSNNDATFVNDRAHILNRTSHELRNGDRILISDAVALVFRDGSGA
jgi:hypothetical protein